MCKNDINLSLNGDAFTILKEQFDKVLNRTIGNMQMKGAEDAVITLKLSVGLGKERRTTPDGVIDATIPKFKHDISSVMQVKDKVSGELVGDYELVWDEETQKYVMRRIDDGQTTMFDDEPMGRFYDADYEEVHVDKQPAGMLNEGQKALEAPDDEKEDEEEDYQYDQPEE